MFMKKEEVRKEFFKLRHKGFSYAKCKTLIASQFDYYVTARTLKRWNARLETGSWNLMDNSRKPRTIHYKVNPKLIKTVCDIRQKTGWGQDKIKQNIGISISATTIKRIIRKQGLAREVKHKGRRIKWVRWQRKHANSLWQIDHTDEQNRFDCYTLSILDDCSRYSLALVKMKSVTTSAVICVLNELIKIHGKPREILTDNGSAYGGKNKHSKFDRWCNRNGIKHIRSTIHCPTTCGKVERLFKTIDEEIDFCNNDLERFRMRYNCFRPHSSLLGKTPAEIYFSW